MTGEAVVINGKRYGHIEDRRDGYVYRTYRTMKHWCRRHNGWGVQLDLFELLKKKQVQNIVVAVREKDGTEKEWWSHLQDWDQHGSIDILNPEYGEQIFLHEGYWAIKPLLGGGA